MTARGGTSTQVVVHHLRLPGRAVTLLEGPAGWGESSPIPGYPCDPDRARRAAGEAAVLGFPAPRRELVAVNALVSTPDFDPESLTGYTAVKVKLRVPGDVDLVARVRDAVGPAVSVRVDANGAFDVETALGVIERLAALDVDLVE
jgi:o-succinylbenzoate synthase